MKSKNKPAPNKALSGRPMTLRECMEAEDGIHTLAPDILHVGEYRITRYGFGDYWIENASGEGMQVFALAFERLIDDFFKSEF